MRKTLRELRKDYGYTQRHVANSLHMDQTSVSKWENGEAYPRVETLLELAKFYDVKLDTIDLTKKGSHKKEKAIANLAL